LAQTPLFTINDCASAVSQTSGKLKNSSPFTFSTLDKQRGSLADTSSKPFNSDSTFDSSTKERMSSADETSKVTSSHLEEAKIID
jgi:hypothetical protein